MINDLLRRELEELSKYRSSGLTPDEVVEIAKEMRKNKEKEKEHG
jgi:hypothetical protein